MAKTLRVHRLTETAKVPTYAHVDDSGMDVYADEDKIVYSCVDSIITVYHQHIASPETSIDRFFNLMPEAFTVIKTGISVEVPEGYELQMRSKSGLASSYGIWVLNSPGTIDEGYRGEIKVILANFAKKNYSVRKGQKIAQMVLSPVEKAIIRVMDDYQRGSGGLGSTGI